MDTSKHTPGPWVARTSAPRRSVQPHAELRHVVDSASGHPICALWHRTEPYRDPHHFKAGNFITSADEAAANAQLIASAPELLETCKSLLSLIEGSPQQLGLLNTTDTYYDWDEQSAEVRERARAAIRKATGKTE
jgi:hypothetical protein